MIQETFPIIVGGVEVLNERILLTQVENGLFMNGADSVRDGNGLLAGKWQLCEL